MSLLGVDLGTGSVKAVLTDPRGRVLAQASAGYPVDRPRPGRAETDPAAWWRATVAAVREVLTARPGDPPVAVGLSGQMHGVVLTDAGAVPVRPAVLWADTRARAELRRYESLPHDVRRRLANPPDPGMAGPVLGWLHRHEPDAVAAARAALQPKDWLRARLTGELHGEPSDASATLLYDVLAGDWDEAVVAALDIRRDLLPPLLPSSTAPAGGLTPAAAAELGLSPGLPVAAGAADTAAAALGSGVLDAGTVQLMIGTGVQVVTPAPAPGADSLPPVGASTHLYRAATRDGWYAMAAGLTGGQALDWARRMLGLDWATLYALAGQGARPDDPVFLPHLTGERTPYLDPGMRGAWVGLDAGHDREALARAALEGVAFAVADTYAALPAATGTRPRELRLAGGGTLAAGWRQLLADALGLPLRPVDVPHASARGAALLAGVASGELGEADLPELTRPRGDVVVEPRTGDGTLAGRRERYRAALGALRPEAYGESGSSDDGGGGGAS